MQGLCMFNTTTTLGIITDTKDLINSEITVIYVGFVYLFIKILFPLIIGVSDEPEWSEAVLFLWTHGLMLISSELCADAGL